ncbi:hypothetical protein SAMN05444000_10848 [Shimia gijangensis]|uniref:Uncharacterized protein n=1 Tax=Shimia gijangensis TaxID=1470563 RepID=A0A1M6IYC5_9RHOB|nr:hypothetical protein [Shimia gijangensis]SHJ39436.1 hypothetical protein SAMN05444000_10848 [Shimia gijangensis]
MTDEILATVSASAPRRWLGVGVMALLGALLLYVAFAIPPGKFLWQAFLVVLGLAALALAEKTRRATERVIELTAEGLRDSAGEMVASIEQIDRIERGTFAMKPSNGFLVRLKTPRARRWLPGLWWATGRRVGIGGVTPGSQTKFMAQMLEAMLAERN